jgi:hypothetical protein
LEPSSINDEMSLFIQDWVTLFILFHSNNAGFDHFMIEIISFTGTLTNTGEEGKTTMPLGDVVDQFHDDNCLADAGTTECADLTALGEGTDQINDLDAGFKNLGLGVLID